MSNESSDTQSEHQFLFQQQQSYNQYQERKNSGARSAYKAKNLFNNKKENEGLFLSEDEGEVVQRRKKFT